MTHNTTAAVGQENHPPYPYEQDDDDAVEERVIVEEQLVEHEEDAEHYRLHGPRDHFNPHLQRPSKKSMRGSRGNPIFLLEKIIRNRIFESAYYKQHCFGLTAETLIEKAIDLQAIGGCYGGNRKPAPFLCLLLRMLYIEVDHEIVLEYINNEHYKYVTALGAFYLRMTADAAEVYRVLEPLYDDYRKLRFRKAEGNFEIVHMDQFVETLLTEEDCCGIKMPLLLKRRIVEERGQLDGPRKSYFDEFDEEDLEEMLQELQEEEEEETIATDTNEAMEKESHEDEMEARMKDVDEKDTETRHERRHSPSSSSKRDKGRSHRLRFKESRRDGPSRRRSRHDDNDDGLEEKRGHKRKSRPSSHDDERPTKSKKSGGDTELSIEETNKLRKQLGLAPLKL